jgi:hypothetical protein
MYLEIVVPCLLAFWMSDVPQQPPPPAKPAPATAPKASTRRARVVTKLEGFELAKTADIDKQTTVAAASRGSRTPLPIGPRLARVHSPEPVLTWDFEGAADTAFTVRLYNEDEEPVAETTVTGRSYRYGSIGPSLRPGQTYHWTVEVAGMPQSRSEMAGLSMVDADERAAIAARLAAVPADGKTGALARARMFVEARLWYDALAAYDAAIAASPDSADAHEGRGELLAQLPAFQTLADAAFSTADALRREGR